MIRLEEYKGGEEPVHLPIFPMTIYMDFGSINTEEPNDMVINLNEDSGTYLFQYSSIGGNALNPRGYVRVNIELFRV
jgi:hypothetical protein